MTPNFNKRIATSNLEELASKELQRRRWLFDGTIGNEVSSPNEAYCGLFDDSGLSCCFPDETGLSEEFVQKLETLESAIKKVISKKVDWEVEWSDPVGFEISN